MLIVRGGCIDSFQGGIRSSDSEIFAENVMLETFFSVMEDYQENSLV